MHASQVKPLNLVLAVVVVLVVALEWLELVKCDAVSSGWSETRGFASDTKLFTGVSDTALTALS